MPARYPYARRVQWAIDEYNHAAGAELAAGFAAAVDGATRETAKAVREIGRVIALGIAHSDLARAHQTIGAKAQDSVLRSYDQTVTARNKRRLGPYRDALEPARNPKNRRYAAGKLRAALGDPTFFEADHRGIRFINTDLLDRRARQWARLSAGAGGRGSGSRRKFEVRWSNLVVTSLGLNMAPSPAFIVPKGYWFDRAGGGPVAPGARGTAEFYPLGEGPRASARSSTTRRDSDGRAHRVPLQRRRISRGIEARNFLDAGVGRMARELGPTYERMYQDWFRRGVVTARPARATIHVTTRRVNLAA